MTTSDDAARNWRDVADQLTPAQVTQLERLEQDEPQTLLEIARQWATQNSAAPAPIDNIAPPAGAVRTFDWQLDGSWFRDFEGTTRRAGPARVQIYGRQRADASVRRWIAVQTRHLDALGAAAARELAAMLTDAANEVELCPSGQTGSAPAR
ncbi:hypothetical protein [Mycobacterium intracellulare]|uniref:Uncharacterized protein n=1 Tax=Mycobacterium intracellulare subsp. chimaera TaxID=222805 RepID=A0A7U5RVB2_MYCIT|nr:hypothetical protein [Mycobacterium intracellulare]ASL15152.1 hypothetical protein MYCOZU2_02751 [Mycobacterium intracellulare subsp. chimaera]ASQ86336.1 hypothetical protein CE197_12520 [Mycobacterium intracellulare subsp. chimaera]MCF1811678.1 hypothetical protein [Mycobacterium intracellulare subsp. intracellulare]MDM3926270.1 hypothetical protein [Mycobacterium intracellulare subsp. chimaera]MDS0333211.1 hypothetical protein [Mycobacterium intracellulare]